MKLEESIYHFRSANPERPIKEVELELESLTPAKTVWRKTYPSVREAQEHVEKLGNKVRWDCCHKTHYRSSRLDNHIFNIYVIHGTVA